MCILGEFTHAALLRSALRLFSLNNVANPFRCSAFCDVLAQKNNVTPRKLLIFSGLSKEENIYSVGHTSPSFSKIEISADGGIRTFIAHPSLLRREFVVSLGYLVIGNY